MGGTDRRKEVLEEESYHGDDFCIGNWVTQVVIKRKPVYVPRVNDK